MIAKHIPMNSVKKSDFAGLAKYIADSQGKDERVESVTVTNCHASFMVASTGADRLAQAIVEITNTQKQNTRAESDKTYHLLVSFRTGERPDDAALCSIESRLCEGLGFGEHQRVSAVHTDTDHLHIHIAINKIHPTRHTIYEPYYPHKTLAKLCASLEQAYGLEIDNHRPFKVSSENKAKDMEHHAGVESLLGWIKRECGEQLKAAHSWATLQQVLADHGLELRERGNGFVFVDEGGLMVKTSSVARELSKVKLEKKFGVFNSSTMNSHNIPNRHVKKSYEAKPLRSRINTTALFMQYQKEQRGRRDLRARELKVARHRKDRLIDGAKLAGKLLRGAVKLSSNTKTERKLLYALNSKVATNKINRIKEEYARERQIILERHRPQQWADWLRRKASAGDSDALAALRARESAQGLKGNTLRSAGRRTHSPMEATQDSVTKTGTIIYRAGLSAIRDDGKHLQVSRGSTRDCLEAALRLAMNRYGNLITVNGAADFKAQIVGIAAARKLPLNFSDSALESMRLSIINHPTTTMESSNEPTDRGRGAGSGIREPGSPVRVAHSERRHGWWKFGFKFTHEPNLESATTDSPPRSLHNLRHLSELNVVRFTEGSEVLLRGDPPVHLDNREPKPNNPLRRREIRKGVAPLSFDAADRYIEERERKRVKLFDILTHRRYNEADAGIFSFAGVRWIDDNPLALLKRNHEILVMPVAKKAVSRLSRLVIGDFVTCAGIGSIKKRGRSR